MPGDPDQVIYVWFDALGNYLTALGYGGDDGNLSRWWTEAASREHVIGKGITRFHAVYWPAMLLSADLPVPTRILVHGYVTVEGRKIGKSAGNRFVAGFIGSPKMNFIDVEVVAVRAGAVRVHSSSISAFDVPADASGVSVGDELTLGGRPQALIVNGDGQLAGKIAVVERLGSETIVNADLADNGSLLAVLDGDRPLEIGSEVKFAFDHGQAVLFNSNGRSLLAA